MGGTFLHGTLSPCYESRVPCPSVQARSAHSIQIGPLCSEKAEMKRAAAVGRTLTGERAPRERGPATSAQDDEDLEWQLLLAANRDAGCGMFI